MRFFLIFHLLFKRLALNYHKNSKNSYLNHEFIKYSKQKR